MSTGPAIPRDRPLVYLAGPLFSEAEREFNVRLRDELSGLVDVYLPQEQGGLLVKMVGDGASLRDASETVFRQDIDAIAACDALVVILDGRSVDEGAAVELGYAYGQRKPCFGLQTDPRREILGANNPMIEGSCDVIVSSIDALKTALAEWIPLTVEGNGARAKSRTA